jgi:hypothetical protein
MGKKDPRVDAVIAKSSDFARPILVHIRKVVHETCPDVEETLKFKEHCTFGFWKASLITPANRFGRDRVTSLADLPPTAELKRLIRKAMALNDATREGRLATAVGWISQGKSRNWKYEKC